MEKKQTYLRPVRCKAQEAKPSRLEPFIQLAPSLLQALVLAVLGYVLTDRVDQALKDRQATVASINSMTKLLDEIAKEEKEEHRLGLIRQLSMYGIDAIGPLVTMALSSEKIPVGQPAEGLTLIAINHPKQVCEALGKLREVGSLFRDSQSKLEVLAKREKALCGAKGTRA